jgi:hypothetical protein
MKWPQESTLKLRDQPRHEAHACNCIGPQNGAPVCPCRMPAYQELQAGKRALEILAKIHKPRIRVKAGSNLV